MIVTQRIKLLNAYGKLEGVDSKTKETPMSFPNVARILPIATNPYGPAVTVGRGFMGPMLRDDMSITTNDGNIKMSIPSQRSATLAFLTLTGLGVAGAVVGGAVSGNKAGRGRNALGGGIGAVVGLGLGTLAVKLIMGV